MTKHQKEKQRFIVKWLLVSLLVILVLTGILGSIYGLKDSHLLLMVLGEIVVLTGVFFGFDMSTKVSTDEKNFEG